MFGTLSRFDFSPILIGSWLDDYWIVAPILSAVSLLVGIIASAHVVLHKRDARAAIGWVGIILLTPFFGTLLYVTFGINRIRRRARQMFAPHKNRDDVPVIDNEFSGGEVRAALSLHLGERQNELWSLPFFIDRVVDRPLVSGARIVPFESGDDAYEAMLRAIDSATKSVSLCSYIFDNDRIGQRFVESLGAAQKRGVEVRVLIDDVGARYSWPSVTSSLAGAGVKSARFLPTLTPWRMIHTNLRNHRKIMVVDGITGFTGGMNIREGHALRLDPKYPVLDLHFLIEGPVVSHLQETFATDWEFCSGETLSGDSWFPRLSPRGNAVARGISDGPDLDFEKLQWALLGAIGCAQEEVLIATPYFLPENSLVTALCVADLRGVDVKVVVPSESNLTLVQWASIPGLRPLLERGVQVFRSPPPFDHSKLMVVDRKWTLIGSANWDARSLRLNFEFNVECYDVELATQARHRILDTIGRSKPYTMKDFEARTLAVKLRDGVARLFSPYL